MRTYLYLRTFPRLGTPLNGGLRKAIHGLATGLVHAGAKVTILCEGREAGHIQTEFGYDIRCFPNRTGPSSFTVSPELKEFIEQDMEFGVVVLNGIFMPAVAMIARLLKKKGIRYIAAPHDPYHPEIFRKKSYMKWPYWYLLERPMLRNATAIQVLDADHRDCLRELDVATTVIPLPNGYLPEDAEHLPTPLPQGDPRLLFLGRMDSHNKGLDHLLAAFARLGREGRAKLTLQGPSTGDLRALQKQARSLKRKDQIKFLPVDFSRTSAEVIADHHIVCLPSRFEGFGMAALEAMLAGRPVLVSCVSGIALHVAKCGCGVVVHSDVKSIHEGLAELMSLRSEWAEMGRRGREYALQHLNWQDIGEKALREYRRVCKFNSDPQRWATPAAAKPSTEKFSKAPRFDESSHSAAIPEDTAEAILSDA